MDYDPKVDLCFSIRGKTVSVDHGFDLLLLHQQDSSPLHEAQDVGLKTDSGQVPRRWIDEPPAQLLAGFSAPFIRSIPVHKLGWKHAGLEGHLIQIGVPKTKALMPAPELSLPLGHNPKRSGSRKVPHGDQQAVV